jgi:Right handed beta helix region
VVERVAERVHVRFVLDAGSASRPAARSTAEGRGFWHACAMRIAFLAILLGGCVVDPRITALPPCAAGYSEVAGICVRGVDGSVRRDDAGVPTPDGGGTASACTPDAPCKLGESCASDQSCRSLRCQDARCVQPEPDRAVPLAVTDPLAPVLFFSDLTSGPASGGEGDAGVFVTLFGLRLGRSPNSVVTYDGRDVARIVSWNQDENARGLESIVLQIGPGSSNGAHDFVVTVDGRSSNPLAFTQRNGGIFFVDTAASPGGDGSVEAPWNSIYSPGNDGLRAGDTVFVRAAQRIDTIDPQCGDSCNWRIPNQGQTGTADKPIAFVGYPGQRPELGFAPDGSRVRNTVQFNSNAAYVTLANFTLTGSSDAAAEVTGDGRRLVNVHFFDARGGFEVVVGYHVSGLTIFGSLLESCSSDFVWICGRQDHDYGWNEIRAQPGAAFHLGGWAGDNLIERVSVHDNLILGGGTAFYIGGNATRVAGGTISNNIVTGTSRLVTLDEDSSSISSDLLFESNTFHRAGQIGGAIQSMVGRATFVGNIFVAASDQSAYASVPEGVFGGSANLYWGASGAPGYFDDGATRVVADPRLSDPASADFTLESNSAARDMCSAAVRHSDYFGIVRDTPTDLGAISYVSN